LQAYSFSIKHKASKLNQVADTLSRRHSLLNAMQVQVLGFDVVKELYKEDPNFGYGWKECSNGPNNHFLLQDGFLFKNNHLCIPQCSLRRWFSFQKQPFMHSPMFIKRSHYQRSPWRRSCWSFWQRQNFNSRAGEFHLAQDGSRCCVARKAMSNFPPRKESQTEHWTIYSIACPKCPMGRY
jgi:hypothetical protein